MTTTLPLESTAPVAVTALTSDAKRSRILVVDDDPAVCRMLEMALDIAGHDVVSILDARTAISFLESNPVDLVITDLVMPEIEGIEVIMRVSHVHPTIPIVAISGEGADGPEEYLSIAKLLGAHRTLSKPFDCRQLVDVVDQLLAGQM